MKRLSKLALAMMCISSSASWAATIAVQPGHETLQNAIDAASQGDILTLVSGSYTDTGAIYITKALTIRALDNSQTPVLNVDLDVDVDVSTSHPVVIQGLTMSSADIGVNGQQNTPIYALENNLTCGSISLSTNASSVAVANSIVCDTTDYYGSQGIDAQVIAGNDLSTPNLETYYGSRLTGDYIIGNEIITGYGSNQVSTNRYSIAPSKLAIGNKVKLHINDSGVTNDNFMISGIYTRQNVAIQNNIVELEIDASLPLTNISFSGILYDQNQHGARIYNNLITMLSSNAGSAKKIVGIEALHAGNVVANTVWDLKGQAIDAPNAHIANNICHNNTTDCGTENNNLSTDPLLNADAHYTLQSGSPAIDAGPVFNALKDIDGSRNDIGAMGGAFPIKQFSDMREDTTGKPLIFPLFNTSETDVAESLTVEVISIARLPAPVAP